MKKKKRYSIFELAATHAQFDILAYIEKKWKECTTKRTGEEFSKLKHQN